MDWHTQEKFVGESNKLSAAWNRHDLEALDRYLVNDVEDPRINTQSIIKQIFPNRYRLAQ